MGNRWQDGFPEASTNWRAPLRAGFVVIGLSFGVCGGWAAVARLDGAAVGPGVVAVESNKKTVQHLEGGIVSAIHVRDGDLVQQGDVLLRLDRTRAEATSDLYRRQLAAALAMEARLVAERDGLKKFVFPPEVTALKQDPIVSRAMADQTSEFEARSRNVESQTEILRIQIEQIKSEIEGVELERKTAEDQLVFIAQELEVLRGLWKKNLIELPRISGKEVEQLRVRGQIARAAVDVAKAQQRIGEAKLKIDQLRQERQREASQQLPQIRGQISDVRQQIVLAEHTLQHIEVRAPTTGTVQQLRIFTIGGVLRSGDPILDIVPATDELVIRAKMSPNDAHTVRPGMVAEVRFPAFHQVSATLPAFMGQVRSISGDRLIDETDPQRTPYFAVEVSVDRGTIPDDVRSKVTAGLAADVIVPTGERTALEYLISPIAEKMHRGMRER